MVAMNYVVVFKLPNGAERHQTSDVIEIMVIGNIIFERVRCVAIIRVGADRPVRVAKIEGILSVVAYDTFVLVDIKLLESMTNCIEKLFAMSENGIVRR